MHHCFDAAIIHFIEDGIKVFAVVNLKAGHLQHKPTPGLRARRYKPVLVGRNTQSHAIAVRHGINAFLFKNEPVFRHNGLQRPRRFAAAAIDCFVGEHQQGVPQVGVEISGQVALLCQVLIVAAHHLAHGVHEHALTCALWSLHHHCRPLGVGWVLQHVGHPVQQPLEMRLVFAADNFKNVVAEFRPVPSFGLHRPPAPLIEIPIKLGGLAWIEGNPHGEFLAVGVYQPHG